MDIKHEFTGTQTIQEIMEELVREFIKYGQNICQASGNKSKNEV